MTTPQSISDLIGIDRQWLLRLDDARIARESMSRNQRSKNYRDTVPVLAQVRPRVYERLLAAGLVHRTDVTEAGQHAAALLRSKADSHV